MICRKCNREISQNTKFCPYCGNSVAMPVSNNQPNSTPLPVEAPVVKRMEIKPKKKNNALLIVIIVLLVIAIAGIVAYLLGAFDGDKPSNGNPLEGIIIEEFPEEKEEVQEEKENILLLSIDPYEYVVTSDTCEISGTASVTEKDGVLRVNGKRITAVYEDEEYVSWSTEVKLDEGDNVITVELSDTDGNSKKRTLNIMREIEEEDGFLFESDRYYISESDLYGKTQEEVALIRNEIYARHGYIFNTDTYAEYFSQKPWYEPNPDFSEALFNEIEKANKDFLVQYEADRGWR